MKRMSLLLLLGTTIPLLAAPPEKSKPIKHDPPPISTAPVQNKPAEQFIYEQKPMAGRPVLIAPEQAQKLIERFKAGYPKLGSPRFAIYVNRELVDESSGLKLSGRTERIQNNSTDIKTEFKVDPNAPKPAPTTIPGGGNVTIVGDVNGLNRNNVPGAGNVTTKTEKSTQENSYKANEKTVVTLADKQTMRDVERLFGRPLRMGGANLADQRLATQLIADKPLQYLSTEGEQARKDREALSKITDAVIEVLISSRQVTVTELSGDKTYVLPDIQATALRLSDSKILGQATATDIIGKDRYAGNIARNFDVREIAEATALALMEDMLLNVSE
jgi:hypothetical protein